MCRCIRHDSQDSRTCRAAAGVDSRRVRSHNGRHNRIPRVSGGMHHPRNAGGLPTTFRRDAPHHCGDLSIASGRSERTVARRWQTVCSRDRSIATGTATTKETAKRDWRYRSRSVDHSHMEPKHEKYERLIARCASLEPVACAVVHPCDESSLRAAVEAAQAGLIRPVLVGPETKIKRVAADAKLDLAGLSIVDAPHSEAAAEAAVRLAREGKVEALMKGSLHTDELMAAVVKRDTGLRTSRRVSHCFVMDVPSLEQALIITDCAINIAPTLQDKVHIIQNAIDLAHVFGRTMPRVAILSAM